MPITRQQISKLKVADLKAIMRKYSIKGLSGRKASLITKITNHARINEIMANENMPVKVKRKFSKKQLANQQRFKDILNSQITEKSERLIEEEIKPVIKPVVEQKIDIEDEITRRVNEKLKAIEARNKAEEEVNKRFLEIQEENKEVIKDNYTALEINDDVINQVKRHLINKLLVKVIEILKEDDNTFSEYIIEEIELLLNNKGLNIEQYNNEYANIILQLAMIDNDRINQILERLEK